MMRSFRLADAVNSQGFVHLRVRSAYSLLEGAIKASKIGKMAADAGMPAVGVADRANLFGALEFSQTTKDAGVQPIVACALPVLDIGGQVVQTSLRASTLARPAGVESSSFSDFPCSSNTDDVNVS